MNYCCETRFGCHGRSVRIDCHHECAHGLPSKLSKRAGFCDSRENYSTCDLMNHGSNDSSIPRASCAARVPSCSNGGPKTGNSRDSMSQHCSSHGVNLFHWRWNHCRDATRDFGRTEREIETDLQFPDEFLSGSDLVNDAHYQAYG